MVTIDHHLLHWRLYVTICVIKGQNLLIDKPKVANRTKTIFQVDTGQYCATSQIIKERHLTTISEPPKQEYSYSPTSLHLREFWSQINPYLSTFLRINSRVEAIQQLIHSNISSSSCEGFHKTPQTIPPVWSSFINLSMLHSKVSKIELCSLEKRAVCVLAIIIWNSKRSIPKRLSIHSAG